MAILRLADVNNSEVKVAELESRLEEIFTELTGIEYGVVINNAEYDGFSNVLEIRPAPLHPKEFESFGHYDRFGLFHKDENGESDEKQLQI